MGRTISDLSARPLALAVGFFFVWGPYGRVSPSAVIVAGGVGKLQDLALDPDQLIETRGASVILRATRNVGQLYDPQYRA